MKEVRIIQMKKMVYYVLSSMVLFGIACLVIPKISKSITNKMYKSTAIQNLRKGLSGPPKDSVSNKHHE